MPWNPLLKVPFPLISFHDLFSFSLKRFFESCYSFYSKRKKLQHRLWLWQFLGFPIFSNPLFLIDLSFSSHLLSVESEISSNSGLTTLTVIFLQSPIMQSKLSESQENASAIVCGSLGWCFFNLDKDLTIKTVFLQISHKQDASGMSFR